ncbi:MAG: hypothetical protein P4K80_04365 [Acidobacteriaceae bacterium]|nr:hypothetical protein [Acidobacteriaceae bacterium]
MTDLAGIGLTGGDVLGCLRGVVAFAAVLLAPGYCLAWACNLLGFRKRAAGERLAWGVALSFAAMTILAILLGKYNSLTAVCWLAGICSAAFLAILAWEARRPGGCGPFARAVFSKAYPKFVCHSERSEESPHFVRSGNGVQQQASSSKSGLLFAGIAALWVLFVVGELVDIGVGSRLFLSVTVFDHALRTAFVDAVLRTGVPPANPLYWPGHPAAMRYYYFWYVLVAAAAKLAGATARQAMIASVAWAGFGLAATLELYCKHFLGIRTATNQSTQPEPCQSRLAKTRWMGSLPRLAVALGLLAVTGLDILPTIALALLGMPTNGDMEWWASDQVTSWVDSMLWVPHHVAGLVCCLVGFLLVWMSKGQGGWRRWLCAVLAGLAFASAFGLSTWVAIAFALVMAVWGILALVWERDSRGRVAVLLVAGAVAALALLPYLGELRAEASGVDRGASAGASRESAQVAGGSVAESASHLLRFGVRHVIPAESLQGVGWIARLAKTHPALQDAGVGLLLLLPGYIVELGFYGFVLVSALWAMRRRRLGEAGRASVVLACAGLAVATFLRSSIVENNDFGMRSILIAQFFMLLLAVLWWEGGLCATNESDRSKLELTEAATGSVVAEPRAQKSWSTWAMLAMAGLGLVGTVYQAVTLRVYLPVEQSLGRAEQSGLAEWAMALRRGFDAMDSRVGRNAVVQYNTTHPGEYFNLVQVMQVGRQVASGQPGCGVAFGGEVGACKGGEEGVARLFSPDSSPTSQGALTATEAREECSRLGVDDLVATRWDGVWRDEQSWVWTLPALVASNDLRVLDCSAPTR